MKKILFFTQNRWAFGAIHHALIKELYKHNIYANLLDWNISYTREEFELLLNTYDLFVTLPEAALGLHEWYGVPLNRIIVIAHEQWDIFLEKKEREEGKFIRTTDFYSELKGFAAISKVVVEQSKTLGLSKIPAIVECGINFNEYYEKPSNSLKRVGYGGASNSNNFFGIDRKRGNLVKPLVESINGLQLVTHNYYNFLCMPAYYKKVDCVIMSSIEEAGGQPMLECAASGRLPIGTPVGYFEKYGPMGGGIVVPLDEENFIKETKEHLLFFQKNPEQYIKKCLDVQEFARENYDWSTKVDKWIELFNL
jgi:glycosyltransferase involved in cell wall biosynthesis